LRRSNANWWDHLSLDFHHAGDTIDADGKARACSGSF
jgi:hypothetical protein